MPKKIRIEDLKLTIDHPTVDAIRFNCKCTAKTIEKCTCNKYFYIVGDLTAKPTEQYRVSSGVVDIKVVRDQAAQWERKLDRRERELSRKHATAMKQSALTPAQLFDNYIAALQAGQDVDELALKGKAPSVEKMKTVRRELCGDEDPKKAEKKPGFLSAWNVLPRAEKKIGANETVDKIEFAETITPYWMQHAWKLAWFDGKGSPHSIRTRRAQCQSVWHYGYRTGALRMEPGKVWGGKHCQCPACAGILIPKKMTKKIKPTPPLELLQYKLTLDACGGYEESLKDLNKQQLRCTNERLRIFCEIMANCGPRRIDTSLVRRNAFKVAKEGSVIWRYVPVKNGDEAKPIEIPFPRHLYDRLMALPQDPHFFHPDFFFFSGPKQDWESNGSIHEARLSVNGGAFLRNAPDPWSRAIQRLVQLLPEAARKGQDERNKLKEITPHMFRDTFCVECWVQGMSFRQIAEAVDDDEETIKASYQPYTNRKRVRDSVKTMEEGVRHVQEALAGLDADALMRKAGIAF